jgi:twinkle protein
MTMADAENGAAVLDAEIARRPRIFGPGTQLSSVQSLWRNGLPPGDKTGWPSVDRLYTVVPGQFTVVTGWPGSGKSEWLDALLVNLSRQGWKIAVFSPENQPVQLHIAKLLEKLAGKPFGAGPTARMTEGEVRKYADDLNQAFAFIEAPGDGALSAKDVIECATPWLAQFKDGEKRGLVIDPWNELEHWRPANLSETEYVSKTLSMVRNWARQNSVHVWIVAHPQKMRREDGKLPIPRPDMISGSQHWWNKADCAITVYRDFEKLDSQAVEIYVQKVRFKHVGKPGFVTLHYDRVTGRYHVPPGQVRDYRAVRDGAA